MEKFRPEKSVETKDRATLLEETVERISQQTNLLMKEAFGVESFLQDDGRLDTEKYMERAHLSRSEYGEHLEYIKNCERSFAKKSQFARDNKVQIDAGQVSRKELKEKWEEEERDSAGKQMELLTMALFHKFFSEDFIVVRSSTYDDYKNKMDLLLINKKTGAVICAFDDFTGDKEGRAAKEKGVNIEDIVRSGGASLRYGFCVTEEEGGRKKLTEKELTHLPIFQMQTSAKEFQQLFMSLVSNPSKKPTGTEVGIMKEILKQMQKQCEEFEDISPNDEVSENINLAWDSFNQMEVMVGRLKVGGG